MVLLNPNDEEQNKQENNESQESDSTFDWDSLLSDIQKDLGPSPVIAPNAQALDNVEPQHDNPRGQCLYCKQCKDIKLWFPAFPPNPYHLPIVMWLRTLVAPLMQQHQRCFICVMMYILNSSNFTILDQIIAEKLMQALPDILTMPKSCIHADSVDDPVGATPPATAPEEPAQPKTEEKAPEQPRNIRQIIADFQKNEETE